MNSPKLFAVIDVGSTAVRMVVAEIDEKGEWRRVDRAIKPVPLGRDVFMSGSISRDTTLLCLRILTASLNFCPDGRSLPKGQGGRNLGHPRSEKQGHLH